MALTKELLRVLDDKEEPLPKRLKLADNAFRSVDFPIQHREAILLKWLGKTTKASDKNVWELLLSWLTSQQMQDLNRNEIGRDDVRNLMNVLTKHVKSPETAVLNCATALIENRNFQLCFKYDLEEYCKFIANIATKIPNANELHTFLTNEQLFNKSLVSSDNFHKVFVENTLGPLAQVAEKFPQKLIFDDVSNLLKKCVFHQNVKSFGIYLQAFFENATEKPPVLPKLLFKHLKASYENNPMFKLVFHAYCASYGKNFDMVYKFFVILAEMLGFDACTYFDLSKIKKFQNTGASLYKSVTILSDLCEVLTETTNDLSFKLAEKTFTEFLQNLTLSVIKFTGRPNESSYKFLNCIIRINPIIVEKTLSDVLVYVMLSNTQTEQYEKFLKGVFEVFAKLHRIPHLISKMLLTLESAFEGNFTGAGTSLEFLGSCATGKNERSGNLLPAGVLEFFTQCMTTLVSWQVINVFQTLFFRLEGAVKNHLAPTSNDSSKIVYIELISTLMCQFFWSVRIAEQTVLTNVVEKFVSIMNDLKDILGKFGTALVKMEHNLVLMRAYLNICHAWGELYITLAYYSLNDEVTLQKTLDNDSSACNITYLHPYLTRDQWCLIAQRITNFGEKPCKQIMQKLYVQKMKALLLFEEKINEEILVSIRTSVSSSLEDNWKDIIFDPLVLGEIVAKSSNAVRIAELIVEDVVVTKDFQQLRLLFDCRELLGALLYACVCKMNKILKRKHKHKLLSLRFFAHVDEGTFLSPENLSGIVDTLVKELAVEERSKIDLSINEADLRSYLEVIETIPIMQCSFQSAHQILILYLICVTLDLQRCSLKDPQLVHKCESIIIGLGQSYPGSLKSIIEPFRSTQIIVENFERYSDIFTLIVHNIFKNETDFEALKNGISFLTTNVDQEKYLQCSLIMIKTIQKTKQNKAKFSAESRNLFAEYQEDIFKSILRLLVKEKDTEDIAHLIEAYALTLKHYLQKSSEEVQQLLPLLNKYVDAVTNAEALGKKINRTVLLLGTILHHKIKIDNLQEDFVMRAWTCCRNLRPNAEEYEHYSKLVMLIFEHVPNEQFCEISTDLLRTMGEAIKEDPKQLGEQFKIWSGILGCSFSTIKIEMLQKILSTLLLDILLVYLKDKQSLEDIYEDVVNLEISIMRNLHIILTPSLVDAVLLTVSIIVSKPTENFTTNFNLSISLMHTLLKCRSSVTVDYLPPYLQRYRALLTKLCAKSHSDLKLEPRDIQQLADCAHKLEKLTVALVACDRPVTRVAPYLIADILKQYEEITLYSNVKMHLNNCLYGLISLCDEYAVAYLMRILSTASTEMFKVIYDNFRKYYRYTGKV